MSSLSTPSSFLTPQRLKWFVLLLFGGFLLWDLYTCFDVYVHAAILGDVAAIALPVDGYSEVLEDPLGIQVLLTGEAGAGTNRFWAHYITATYFNNFPLFLQQLGVAPVDSLYLASGLMKLLTQLGIMWLLSKWVLGKTSIVSTKGVVVLAFVCSFFFTADTFHREFDLKSSMIIIDRSIAYNIFYATSLMLLMFYFHPFLQRIRGYKEPSFPILQHIGLFLFSFVVSFNGALNSPTILILCPLLLLVLWIKNYNQLEEAMPFVQKTRTAIQQLPKGVLWHFIWLILLNLYSFYLGTFNAENPVDAPPLMERYGLFLQGLYYQYIWHQFHPSPLGIMVVLTLLNTGLVAKVVEPAKRQQYLYTSAVVSLFIVAYLLLLPFGGYRHYRHYIVRYDVIMPTTVALLFLFFRSSYLLVHHLKGKARLLYGSFLLGLMIFLAIADHVPNPPANACERASLEQFAEAEEQLVELPPCPVMAWGLFLSPRGHDSGPVSIILHRWGVTDNPDKRFYHNPPQ